MPRQRYTVTVTIDTEDRVPIRVLRHAIRMAQLDMPGPDGYGGDAGMGYVIEAHEIQREPVS